MKELDPLSTPYQSKKKEAGNSFIPIRVIKTPENYCFCGNVKKSECDKCAICCSNIMSVIEQSVTHCQSHSSLKDMLDDAV